jgi:hypothetical protein
MFSYKRYLTCTLVLAALICNWTTAARGQKTQPGEQDDKGSIALKRSTAAGDVIRAIAALPEGNGIPRGIAQKMNLIGVVPDAFEFSMLFSKGLRGHGIASLKQNGVWSLPAFYFYGKSSGLDFTTVGSKRFDIVMVVVNAALQEKDPGKKNKTRKKDDPQKPELYVYAFADGRLTQINKPQGFFSQLLGSTTLIYDNALNKAIYSTKGDEILLGKLPNTNSPPEAVKFQAALNELFPNN